MGIFNLFKKKPAAEKKPADEKKQEVEKEIVDLFSAKEYDKAITLFLSAKDSGQEVSLAAKISIANSYRLIKDYQSAFVLFEEIVFKEDNLTNQFNYLMALTDCGMASEGKELFDSLLARHMPINFKNPYEWTLPKMHYSYACILTDAGLFDKALEQLSEIKNLHTAINLDDDTYKFIEGFPFLIWVFDLASEIYNGLNKDLYDSDIYKFFYNSLDDKTRKKVDEHQLNMKKYGLYK